MAQPLTKFLHVNSSGINSVLFQCLATRTKSSCKRDGPPPCPSESYLKTLCHKGKTGKDKPEKKKNQGFKSMWYNPECCIEVCKDVLPRYDELYYKASDKCTREYQQTWVECPKFKIAKKPICKFEKIPPLPPMTRKRCPAKDKPKTACSEIGESKLLMRCKQALKGKCPRISLPGCRPGKIPPKCQRDRVPTDCTKVCTPYPAFSECKRDAFKKPRPVECFCLDPIPMCIVWREFHKRQNSK